MLLKGNAATSICPAQGGVETPPAAPASPPATVVHSDGRLRRPTETGILGEIARGECRVECDVEIAPLQIAADGRMIRKAIIRVREVNQIQLLDELG